MSDKQQSQFTDEFAAQSRAGRNNVFGEFWLFLKHNKKWWLLPILIILGLLGLLVFLSGTAVAPFIYPLF
jgi:hypothetical protein